MNQKLGLKRKTNRRIKRLRLQKSSFAKEGGLFVLFVYHFDISQTMAPLVAFLVLLESLQ